MPELDRTYENFIAITMPSGVPLRFYVNPDADGHPKWDEEDAHSAW